MEKIIDLINQEKTVYNFLYQFLKKNRLKNYKQRNPQLLNSEYEERYALNIDKLTEIPEIEGKDILLQKKMYDFVLYVDDLIIDDENKVELILTFATIINNNDNNLILMDNQSSFLISSALNDYTVEQIKQYGEILTSPEVSRKVIAKTEDFAKQLQIYHHIIDYCHQNVSENMTDDMYYSYINTIENMIDELKIENKVKKI